MLRAGKRPHRKPSEQLRRDLPGVCALMAETDRRVHSTVEHLARFYEALADDIERSEARR